MNKKKLIYVSFKQNKKDISIYGTLLSILGTQNIYIYIYVSIHLIMQHKISVYPSILYI